MLLYLLLAILQTNTNGQIDPGNVTCTPTQTYASIQTGPKHSLSHGVLQLTVVTLSAWRTGGSKTTTSLPPASGMKPQALSMQGNVLMTDYTEVQKCSSL